MAKTGITRQDTAVFPNVNDAVAAYRWLRARGYAESEISVLLSERSRDAFQAALGTPHVESDRDSAPKAEASGAAGVAVGAGLFALAGLSLSGLGVLAAGPLIAALAGGGVGAMVGGLVGGLVGFGFPEESAKAYERALQEGGVALGVLPRNEEDERLVVEQFRRLRGENILTV
jgi:hypothetical protein